MLGSTGVVPHRLRWSRPLRRVTHSAVVVAGALCVALIVAVAVFAGSIAPQDPDEQNFDLIEARPGAKAIFGTDRFGRDVLSRVIHGSRISLYVAGTSITVAMAAGGVLGLTGGYLGGGWDNVINRVLDVFFSIPGLLLSVVAVSLKKKGANSAAIAHPIVYVRLSARVMRPGAGRAREGRGGHPRSPGPPAGWSPYTCCPTRSPFVVQGTVVLSQATSSRPAQLPGPLGPAPPRPGATCSTRPHLSRTAPWISVFPASRSWSRSSLNLLGDGLRDVLDPSGH